VIENELEQAGRRYLRSRYGFEEGSTLMQIDYPLSPVMVAAFNTVLAARAIHCVYQPIVDLDTVETVGFEALARGPSGTTWATPDALVSYAARVARLPELDWICRAAACRGALAADLPREMPLFVNVEPASSRTPCPPDLAKVIESAMDQLQVVIEVTERSVAADPAGLLAAAEQLRRQATRIALDDVGSDTASQAMMSLLTVHAATRPSSCGSRLPRSTSAPVCSPPPAPRWTATGPRYAPALVAELDTAVTMLIAAGAELSEPTRARPPAGFNPAEPAARFAVRDGFHVTQRIRHPAAITTAQFVAWCADKLAPFGPVHQWLALHVGPPA